jgi:hypothetical protein
MSGAGQQIIPIVFHILILGLLAGRASAAKQLRGGRMRDNSVILRCLHREQVV